MIRRLVREELALHLFKVRFSAQYESAAEITRSDKKSKGAD